MRARVIRRIGLAAATAVALCAGILVTVPSSQSTAFAVVSSPDLNVRVVSSSHGVLTVSWTPTAGLGYLLEVDGKRQSNTWDPTLAQTRFSLKNGQHVYGILSVQAGQTGRVTYPTPVTTTTAPVTTTSPTTTVVTTQPTTIVVTTTPQPTGNDCFATPGACGYPDPNFHNVGVPQGVTLKASGGFATTSNGQVINGLKVTGTITVNNSNVTIENTEIVTSGGGGAQAIHVSKGVTGLLIVDSTLHGVDPSPSGAMETGLFNLSGAGSVTAEQVWIYNCTECWQYNGTIQDSYLNDNGSTAAGAHDEAVYNSDGTNVLTHDTLLNPNMQTAVFFGDTGGGCFCQPADNHTTITNSLLAGGGYTIYGTSGSNCTGCGVGASTLVVTNNRFARCGTAYVFNSQTGGGSCSGGQDKFGYWPGGGYFGVSTSTYCPPTPGQQWSGNVWDDTGATIAC